MDENLDNQTAQNSIRKSSRDYDAKPIIIKSKRQIYAYIIALLALFLLNVLAILNANLSSRQILSSSFLISMVGFVALLIMLYKSIQSYKRNSSIYKFSNSQISYLAYDENFAKNCDEISKINHIWFRFYTHGKNQYQNKNPINLLFKTDIGELFFYLVGLILVILFNILIVFPYRIITMNFCKDIVIYFKNDDFIAVMIDNKTQYNEVMGYFKRKNLSIEKRNKFIQMNFKEGAFDEK